MDCLTDIIGLDGCGESSAPFTLNQIGYSQQQLSQLMDDSYADVNSFFEANKKTAAQFLVSDVSNSLPMGSIIRGAIESNVVGTFQEGQQLGEGVEGIAMRLYLKKEFVTLQIEKVEILSDSIGVKDIIIQDIDTGEVYATIEHEFISGLNTIEINESIEISRREAYIFIGYDATGVTYRKTSLSVKDCSECKKKDSFNSQLTYIKGAKISDIPSSNPAQLDKTPGMRLSYSILCNPLQFLCTLKTTLGLAMLYRTAMSILDFSKDSLGQMSEQKMINTEGNEDRWTRASYLYEKEIEKLKKSIQWPANNCFYCEKKIELRNVLP